MHNLSKSRPSSYLFTDLFNKRAREGERKKNMQTNEFACGCNCVLRSSLTRPGLLQPSAVAIHHALLRETQSA